MKTQFYPIVSKLKYFIALIITLFILNQSNAQDRTVTTDPTFWNESVVNGNLTITGNALTNLGGFAGSIFGAALTQVTGNLIIVNCNGPLLTSLNGLQFLTSVGGDVIIENNNNLNDLLPLNNLISIGGQLRIINNNSITSMGPSTPWNLQAVGSVFIGNNASLSGTDPFQNITSTGVIEIRENPNLSFISSFVNTTSCTNLIIDFNTALTSVTGFGNLQSLGYLEIFGNTNLSSCCWAAPLIGLGSARTISGNAIGCESASVINAPPIVAPCPPNQTISTDVGTCAKEVVLVDPLISDNCDLVSSSYMVDITRPGNFTTIPGSPGATLTFDYPVGVSTVEWYVNDANGQVTTCTTIITVEDNQAPQPPGGFPDKFDVDAGANCMATFSVAADGFSENCAMDHYNINISQGGTVVVNEDVAVGTNHEYELAVGTYNYVLTGVDVNGLSGAVGVPINVLDVSAPVWDDANTVKVVEIECGTQTIAEALAANFPTATDCSTFDVFVDTTIPNVTGCGLNEVRHIILARDNAFNPNTSPVYDLTIREVDTQAPVFSNIPGNITISCNDPLPGFPNLTATDECDGDLTSEIGITEIPGMGSCGEGNIAETYLRTATVTDICGNEAMEAWTVTVVSDFSFELGEDVNVCGESFYILNPGNLGTAYEWSDGSSGQALTVVNSGTYTLTVTSNNGCCYSDQITVNLGNNPEVSATGAVISCATGSAQISATSNVTNSTFNWTGPGGFTSSDQNPSVTDAGEYMLTVVTPTGCSSSTSAIVTSDTDVPDASATGGTVSCTETTTEISGTSETAGVSFAWTGPGNFSSSDQSTMVDEPGIYILVVTASNGCTATASAEVVDNQNSPVISINATDVNCGSPVSTLSIDSDLELLEYAWTGPDGFVSSEMDPELMAAGTYELEATAANGCTSSASVSIEEDFAIPDLSVMGGTISCIANSIEISAISVTEGATFSWSGPDGFTSTEANPSVTQPGTYLVQVMGPNGCTLSGPAEVISDSDLPNVSATGGAINCINETVTITGSTTTTGATFSWSGPNGFTSSEAENTVTAEGTYTFTVVSSAGCEAFKEVEVSVDTEEPEISLFQGDLDCESGTRVFSLSTDAQDATFEWSGPDGFSSLEQNPSYSMAGLYNVVVLGTNGCTSEASVEVTADVALTFQITINGSTAEAIVSGGTAPFTFVWDGSTGESKIEDLEVGTHVLEIIDGLGCINSNTFEIIMSGMEDLQDNALVKIYPNPTSAFLTLELDDINISDSQVVIYDISGNEMKRLTKSEIRLGKNRIETSDLSPGFYLLSLNTEGKSINKKFLKI